MQFKYGDWKKGDITRRDFNNYYNKIRQDIYNRLAQGGSGQNPKKPVNYESVRVLLDNYGYILKNPIRYKKLFNLGQSLTFEEIYYKNGKRRDKYWISEIMYPKEFNKIGNYKNIFNMQDPVIKPYHQEVFGAKHSASLYSEYRKIFKTISERKGFIV